MELEEGILFTQFIEETKNHRHAFFQHLEEKYIRNQDDSDVINLNSLVVQKNKGQIKRIKDPLVFGFMRSYSCRKGRNVLKVLRRKVRIKRKYRLTIYDDSEDSSYATNVSSSSNFQDCVVQLVKLDLNHINTPRYNSAAIETTLSKVPKRVDIKFPKFIKEQTLSLSDETSPHLSLNQKKHLSCISSEISICDLSLVQHQGNNNDKSKLKFCNTLPSIKKPRTDCKMPKIDKTRICVELEEDLSITEEFILSDDVNVDDHNSRTVNSLNTFPVMKIPGKDFRLSKNGKTHLFMDVEKMNFRRGNFYNNEMNKNSKVVSLYNSFDNLNLSNCNLQNCPDLSSKISGKCTPCEINYLSRKPLRPSKGICSDSSPVESCRISPLPCPATFKFTHGYKAFSKSISPQFDFLSLKNDHHRYSNKISPKFDIIGLKNHCNRSTNVISTSYSPLKNMSKGILKRQNLF